MLRNYLQRRYPYKLSTAITDCIVTTTQPNGTIRKHLCGIFEDRSDTLHAYLMNLTGIPMGTRESDMRFDGGTFSVGSDQTTSIYLVHAPQLFWQLPWHLRRVGWLYLHCAYPPEDTRCEAITGYRFIPTPGYIHVQ